MARFHVAPSDESMQLRQQYEADPEAFVPPQPQVSNPAIRIETQMIEVPVIVEKEVIKEIKVPEYITVIKEVKVEVPVMMEVEKIVEKIVEIPKEVIVEKRVEVVREVQNVITLIQEKRSHQRTKRHLKITYGVLAALIVLNMIMMVK